MWIVSVNQDELSVCLIETRLLLQHVTFQRLDGNRKTTLTHASVLSLHVFLLKPELSSVHPGVLVIVVTGPEAVCLCDA